MLPKTLQANPALLVRACVRQRWRRMRNLCSSHLVLLQRDVFVNRAARDRDASEGLVGARLLELQLQLLRAENEILGGRCLDSVCILSRSVPHSACSPCLRLVGLACA